MTDEDGPTSRRQPWARGPGTAGESGWLGLSDDELLFKIEGLPAGHDSDQALLGVIRSNRHFFIRQEAAKKIRDHHLLKEHSGDRHIGQILVRGMTRTEDAAYLEKLMVETRHLEVRKAADAQLKLIASSKGKEKK